jgi:hypothetical protein
MLESEAVNPTPIVLSLESRSSRALRMTGCGEVERQNFFS